MVKGCTLGKDSANELMGDFTATFLVRALWIAVENPAPYFSEFGTLNGYGVSKFAASVCQDNWEQTAVLFVSKSFVQPFKNLRDRPCRVSVSQECQEDADDPCVAQYNGGTRGSEFLRCAARSLEVAASHPINLSHRSGSAGAVLLI